MEHTNGFSLAETLVTVLVVSCLSAMGGLIYIEYLESAKHSTLTQTVRNVETDVKLEVDHIFKAAPHPPPAWIPMRPSPGDSPAMNMFARWRKTTANFATPMTARQ